MSLRTDAVACFRAVRAASVAMCAPLSPEEYRLQPMADVSPPWWNLGHTSWFFARNVIAPFGGQTVPEDEAYDYLLNSYYTSLGERLPRDRRGTISRPTTDEIYAYRRSVEQRVIELIETIAEERLDEVLAVLEIGIQHEQQHQELFFTEIKFIRYQNPRDLREPYEAAGARERNGAGASSRASDPPQFVEFEAGLFEFGNLEGAWCWDNELPIHRHYLPGFALANRLVTNREYLAFIEDGGYRDALLWLDNGWRHVEAERWQAPLYWDREGGGWWNWTLGGMRPLALDEPVCHLSFYEADAFARWRSHNCSDDNEVRLPSEREWELAARTSNAQPGTAGQASSRTLTPALSQGEGEQTTLLQLANCLWQWTSSYYEPYPGYQPFPGVLAEYNGKFMDNQRVLRGGSCVTPAGHYRPGYRNFWPAETRFQYTGLRLARTLR